MLIYTSSLRCHRGDCAPPESRRYGANSSGDMNVQLLKVDRRSQIVRRHDGIRVDRGRGINVHETNKKSIDELKRRKVDRRQAGVASKD